jgi:PAS domain S-box-containing protein
VLVVIVFEFAFRSIYGYYSFWASVPAALVIAVTFVPVRERLQKVTDQIFFRRMIEYQNVIKEVTKLVVSVTNLRTLFRLIDRTIVRAMCIKNVAVLILEEKENLFMVEKTNGLPDEVQQIKFPPDSPLTSYLASKKDAVVLDEVKALQASDLISTQEKKDLNGVISELERLGAAVAIPSFTKDKLVGILCMGEKLSGEPYSPDDLELLLTMASEAGIAIENAKLYRDITETRDYLNSLVHESDDAILTMDLSGRILTWNKAAESISGHTSSEMVGKVHPFFLESESQKLIGKVLEGQAIKAHEVNIKNKEEKEIPLLLTLSPIRDTSGATIGLSAIFKDITELKKVERLKHEFLAVVSHELRTPLTPIKGYLALLMGGQFGKIEPKQKRALETIISQSNHLHDLIDSVIDISRIESGKPLELEKEPLFLKDVVEESTKSVVAAFKAKGIEIRINCHPGTVAIMADRKKLIRVMDNLLGNALKFTPNKGTVEISIEKADHFLEVSIADSGIGLAPQHLEKVFGRFYQVDSSYTRSCGGIGMGLSIAQDIIAAHGGKIWAESEGLGKGTRIIFALPLENR